MSLTPIAKMEMVLCAVQKPKSGGMAFYPLTTPEGDDVRLMLGAVGTFPSYIPFEPSVFGGHGGGPRKAIRFAITEEVLLNSVLDVERKAKALLAGAGGKFTWNSAITEGTELYPASLKCKSGRRASARRASETRRARRSRCRPSPGRDPAPTHSSKHAASTAWPTEPQD